MSVVAVVSVKERLSSIWQRLRGTKPGVVAALGTKRPRPTDGPDRLMCGLVLVLTAVGAVMVFSASAAFAAKQYGDFTYFLKREAIYVVLGVGAFTFALRTDYSHWRRFTYPLLFLTLPLLVAVRLVGTRVNGAYRWFRLGPISFQPSELAKLALVLYLAVLLTRKAEKMRDFSTGFVPPLVVTTALAGLVLVQPDLGTAVILGVTAFAMMFVAGTRTGYLLAALLIALPLGWQKFILGEPFRMRRMLAFLDPWQYHQKEGFQLYESLISLGSGGLTGVGLGESRQKLFFLPEAHTDFILAIIGEELGLVGVMSLLLGFVILIWRGILSSLRARDVFGRYLAFGITALLGIQAFMNMAVVLGLMPTKGLSLPFVSYGGTSLVVYLFMAGVLANVSARNPEPLVDRIGKGAAAATKNRRSAPAPRIVVETSA